MSVDETWGTLRTLNHEKIEKLLSEGEVTFKLDKTSVKLFHIISEDEIEHWNKLSAELFKIKKQMEIIKSVVQI